MLKKLIFWAEMDSNGANSPSQKGKTSKVDKKTTKEKKFSTIQDPDVLVNLPAGLKYKVPGKRQRVIIGSIVIGLNVLLVISVAVYFYSPAFQDFVYNLGRG